MRWHDLLFAHWPVPVRALRPLVPAALPLDTFEGVAWLGVVPFGMARVHPRFLPPIGALSAFPELNVRTYIADAMRPGVYFFSLDAASALFVEGARVFPGLPYFRAAMSQQVDGDRVEYRSRRTDRRAPAAALDASYAPVGDVFSAAPGSLERWLTDRLWLYRVARDGTPQRLAIAHEDWPLQRAEAELRVNTMAAPLGVTLPATAPHLMFAKMLDVVAHPPRSVGTR
jgi:uncharacterized protein YqjF (DUF2071 family)